MNGNSYFDIACDDLTAAGEMLRVGLYNHTTRLCQQYIEKIFKQCIHANGKTETDLLLLHTHRLARLADRCGEIKNITFGKIELAFMRELTDYYFDTNYPGENYIKVTEQEAKRVYNEVLAFKKSYENVLCL
jgi:HEPN domain-containing protein